MKSEGRVPLKELGLPGQQPDVSIGDEIEVYVERMEDLNGQAVLSDQARREEAWGVLESSFEKQERVTGVIFGKVKGGFTVDLAGATAFARQPSRYSPSARPWPVDGHSAAIPDFEDRPPPRQYYGVTPRCS